jgi:hypothetical protein
VQFETEKKESDLKIQRQKIQLLTREQQIKDANLEQARLVTVITISGAAIAIVAGLIFYRNTNKKES